MATSTWAKSTLSRRELRLAVVAMLVVVLSACGGNASPAATTHPTRHHAPAVSTPPHRPLALSSSARLVLAAASRFMSLLAEGDYDAQWALLDPAARGQWPSEQARTRMLAAKFAGMTLHSTLGMPLPDQTWVSRETLTQVPGLWQVPCSVTFSGGAPQLPGTAPAFTSLPLYLALRGGRPRVVGEGAASLDAPVLRPDRVPDASLTVPVLMYHDVDPAPNPADFQTTYGYDLQYQLTVSPAEFAQQIAWLAGNGYHAISPARLADALYLGLPLPPNPILITFDDGFLGQYTNAVPILRSHGFTATFFPCTSLVGWQTKAQRYASWTQLRQMSADGFWVEDHTLTDDTTNYGQSTTVLDRLLLTSQQVLEQRIGQPVQFFAYSSVWPYPSAQTSGPLVDNIVPVLERGGYQLALTDPTDASAQVLSTQPYQVPRIRVSPDEPLAVFVANL